MITEFKAGRRYKIGEREYRCAAACGDKIALHSEKWLQVETVTQRLLEITTELPPPPGEYYEGEDLLVANTVASKYLCRVTPQHHAVLMLDWPRPKIVNNEMLSRFPKPKTIRCPPTDQDAIDEPRRKCWVRDEVTSNWLPASLRAVLGTFGKFRFIAEVIDCEPNAYRYCEIEVPNE